jgi:hypothetical protein
MPTTLSEPTYHQDPTEVAPGGTVWGVRSIATTSTLGWQTNNIDPCLGRFRNQLIRPRLPS